MRFETIGITYIQRILEYPIAPELQGYVKLEKDIEGATRPQGLGVDIGPYEFDEGAVGEP